MSDLSSADRPGRPAPPDVPGAPQPEAAPSRASALLERVASALGGRASVRAVYGEPITRDEVTIVPVARARFGFGGGAGGGWKTGAHEEAGATEVSEGGDGGGGGGGADVRPLGYVEIAHGRTTWRPIRSAAPDGRVFAAGVGLGVLLGAAVRGVLRR